MDAARATRNNGIKPSPGGALEGGPVDEDSRELLPVPVPVPVPLASVVDEGRVRKKNAKPLFSSLKSKDVITKNVYDFVRPTVVRRLPTRIDHDATRSKNR
jgi:hypothetical protein